MAPKEYSSSSDRVTLLRPPPDDPSKAPIENVLEITEMSVLGPDIFTNARPLWHPPGARGIYGGTVIAQSIAAGQRTVPSDFHVHSCHCYFLLAGSNTIPIIYHVERVRDGRSFATRTVQARQRGRCIFTVTMSFARAGSGGAETVAHQLPFPPDIEPPPSDDFNEYGFDSHGPFQNYFLGTVGGREGAPPEEKRCRQWLRARGKISPAGGQASHAAALAYVSDSFFIGTVPRIHRLWRFPFSPDDIPPEHRERFKRLIEMEGFSRSPEDWHDLPTLGMMVSLDHTMYFHNPEKLRADEWMVSDMMSPWAGEGRGVVTQQIFSRDGTLLATCMQEGVVRLQQKDNEEGGKPESKSASKSKSKL